MRHASNLFLLAVVPALLAASLLQAPKPPASPTPDGETVTVPFRMLPSNHMVVEAKLNGKGPFRFIFDLGAPVTLLTNKAAEESGAVEKGKPRSLFMAMRGDAEVKRLEMGDLVADKVPVIVMDHPYLGALGGLFQRPLSGIIGYTFWARYKMTIDYQAKKMTFSPVDFEVRDLFKDLPARLAGPKQAQTIMLAPRGIWGMRFEQSDAAQKAGGVAISQVIQGSPAEAGGLKSGDIVTALDGRWTTSIADAFTAAEKVTPGTTAELNVLRDGKTVTLTITPREGL